MNQHEIELIRSDWARIRPNGRLLARLFYTRLFLAEPSLRRRFGGTADGQVQRLMQSMDIVVYGLRQPRVLLPLLAQLGRRHEASGIGAAHYETIGAALLWTLKVALADSFGAASQRAWSKLLDMLAGILLDAARPLSEAA
ncbi:MAG: Flavohemoprotein [Rhodocyclaceae bacterium]|nr:Flavohemoprotein [Rhodocyclaceae bacterium]CAG0943950.1 Flavohemoprotein [Gammaproteobacteria bacterium]